MTPAAHHLLRALYLHALAPSTANQDAVRAAGAALDTETARALNAPRVQRSSGNVFRDLGLPDADAKFEAAKEAAVGLPPDAVVASQEPLGREFNAPVPDQIQIAPMGDDDGQLAWQVWDEWGDLIADGVAPSLAVALAQVAGVVNAPRSPAPVDSIVAEVRADLLARSEVGIAKYGVTLDRADLGLREWLVHFREELMDGVLYATRAMRELDAPQATPQPDLATQLDWHEERVDLPPAQLNRKFCKVIRDTPATAPVEPPHAAEPTLATLTPEPAEAVLARAGEALAGVEVLPEFVLAKPNATTWHPYGVDAYLLTTDGVQRIFPTKEAALRWEDLKAPSGEALAGSLPVYVLAGTGRHPYGDDAWHMETDGVARLFPSKEAAQRWLAAMGRAPV